jgi:hypothetical protein
MYDNYLFPKNYDSSVADNYIDYLRGKNVLLVGGKSGTKIPVGYNIVVRVNDHVLFQGGRCDVLYHTIRSTGLEDMLLLQHPEIVPRFAWLNLVDSPYEVGLAARPVYDFFTSHYQALGAKVGFFAQGEWLHNNPYGEPFEWLNDIHKKHNCKLLTGLVALADLLMHPVKSLKVIGMDLYIDEPKDVPDYRHSHYIPGQIKFLEDAMKDKRLQLPQGMLAAMAKYKSQFGDNHKRTIR